MMKKVLLLPAFLVLLGLVAQAQITSFDTRMVPDTVKKDAAVIKRFESYHFEVTDIDRAILKHRKVLTVLNDYGESSLSFVQYNNKFFTLDEADVKLYDANGKLISKYRKKDMSTSAYGEGLVDDGKYNYLVLSTSTYPVTVEIEYTRIYKGTLFYPEFTIQGYYEGVEKAEYTAKVPKELGLRYQPKNIKISPSVSEEGKYTIYKWQVENLPPISYESGSIGSGNYARVIMAPNRFKMDNFEGDMSSWKSFGNWYRALIKGADALSDERKQFFADMVKDAPTEKEKVKKIYSYLQNNFRYVSIQLGIGGFKPFPADFTDKRKYGDCKGLSNYTQAALASVGIRSHQALIYRDEAVLGAEEDFPCNQFNHAILMVPIGKDSIWLECTSKTLDFGSLDNTTRDRHALVVTEAGGVLLKTPVTSHAHNSFSTSVKVELAEDGSALTENMIVPTGHYKELMYDLRNEKKDVIKHYIVDNWGLKQPDDFEINYKGEAENFHAVLRTDVEKVPEFVAGSKMFLAPRMHKLWTKKLPASTNRQHDYVFRFPCEVTDTTFFMLPSGYVKDALPKEKSLDCGYASFTTKYWFDEEKKALVSVGKLVLRKNRIPSADYQKVKAFFDEVMMDDNQRIVIKKG